MTISDVISIVGLLGIGGILGAFVNNYLENRREVELRISERKEEQYKKFLENLIGFFEGWHNAEKKANFMQELYTHAPLYASSEVIRLANMFLKSFSKEKLKHGGESDSYYRKLVIAIRKDLGHWEKEPLEESDVDVLKLNS